MRSTRRLATVLAAAAVALAGAISPSIASADTQVDHYPETPALNPALPIVETTHGSDHLKANVLNPHPVCNPWEDYRTVVYKVTDDFAPAGTISMTNKSSNTVPLTQNLSKSQSISLSIQGDRTDQTSINLGGNVSQDGQSGSIGIAKSITTKIGASFSYSLSWTAGQQIGPYDIEPGQTGEATYGFRTINLDGTQQYCKLDGTWSNPTPWRVFAPVKNEVEVKTYTNPADSWQGTAGQAEDAADADAVAPEVTVDDSVAAPEVTDGEAAAPEIIPETTTDPNEGELAEQADQATDATETTQAPQATQPAEYDLEPYFTTAAGKAPGFAGLVALRVKNVGTKGYYQENLGTTFRIDVHTAAGPQGVDRLITPGWFNGAYTRDLGFDPATSTRSFEVTLSNPINPGETALAANLNFGDGLTKEGRLKNYLTVTQVGRLAGDTTTGNDQNVDSREHTLDMMNRPNGGLF